MPRSPAPPARSSDVDSISSIVRALYEAVSFPPGGAPDWDRLRSLFLPGARLTPPRTADTSTQIHDVEAFVSNSRQFIHATSLASKGFHEMEISRSVDTFGNIAQVWSTYESRYTSGEPRPVQCGINSIQLLREEGRWWVVSVLWDVEREDNPIPPAASAV